MTRKIIVGGLVLGLVASCRQSTDRGPVPEAKQAEPTKASELSRSSIAPTVPARAEPRANDGSDRRDRPWTANDLIGLWLLFHHAKQAKGTKPPEPSKTSAPATVTADDTVLRRELRAKANKRLADAIQASLQRTFAPMVDEIFREAVKYLSSALNTADPMETQLVAAWLGGLPPGADPEQPELVFSMSSCSGQAKQRVNLTRLCS